MVNPNIPDKSLATLQPSIYRAAIGAYVAGQGDVMIGVAINMARANGLFGKIQLGGISNVFGLSFSS